MFDLVVVLIVGLSTAFAALRGGLRELSTLIALALAGGLTLILVEPLLAVTGQSGSFFATVFLAGFLVAVFFIAAHIGLHIGLRRVPLKGRARLADRVGGGVFGFVRGLILIGLGYLGYSYYLDEANQPDSVKHAITRPVAAGIANWFEGFAPETTQLEQVGVEDEPKDADAALNGYERSDRNGLSEIMTTVTTTDEIPVEPIQPIDEFDEDAAEDSEDPIADILKEDDSE
jgi:membrane protein required for colicin V production